MRCDEMQSVAVPAIDNAVIRIADPNGTCQYVGKDLLGIGGCAADEFEHLCRRTLLFSYRVQLAGKGLNFSFTPEGAYRAPALGY
jgi:hypothetical protein